jgi:hypothetical protein
MVADPVFEGGVLQGRSQAPISGWDCLRKKALGGSRFSLVTLFSVAVTTMMIDRFGMHDGQWRRRW